MSSSIEEKYIAFSQISENIKKREEQRIEEKEKLGWRDILLPTLKFNPERGYFYFIAIKSAEKPSIINN